MTGESADITDFLAQHIIAVAGVSRGGQKFGNRVFRNLKARGYQIYAINPNAAQVEGVDCYPDVTALPARVDGIVSVVPPEETEKLIRAAHAAGVRRIWMQPGAESPAAVALGRSLGMSVVDGECIMLYPG
jgi:uncharacterized protein